MSSHGHIRVRSVLFAVSACIATSAWAWDPVRDLTGRTAKQHVERKIDKAEVAAKKLFKDPVGYLIRLPQSIVADVCSSPIQYYENTLQGQAQGRWNGLPEALIQRVQPYYSVDLRSVQYAVGIRTANGAAQTFGNRIYFPRSLDLSERGDLHWMLHELEHVVQYSGRFGYAGSLCEYTAKAIGSGFRHDSIDWERAADAKANSIVDFALGVMSAQSQMAPRPAFGVTRNQIIIVNQTNADVVFFMETAETDEGEERIPARSWTIFTGAPGDTWFNVRIGTRTPQGVRWVKYGLDGGTRQHIDWNREGVLDFFYE